MKRGKGEFVIDGGSSINLVDISVLGKNAFPISKEIIEVIGLPGTPVQTEGTTILHINDIPTLFYVLNELPLPVDGLIGGAFLLQEEAEISYSMRTIVTKSNPITPIRFSNHREIDQAENALTRTKHRIQGRTRQQIPVAVANCNVTEGYLPPIKTKDKVYIGGAAVTNRDGICYTIAANTNEEDLVIEIEPQYLQPYEIYSTSDDESPYSSSNDHPTIEKGRTTRIKENLRLEHLNSEERKHILDIVDEFSDRFYLPGDKLGRTSATRHIIPTTDNIPITTRQYRYPPVHRDEIQR